MAGGGGDKTTDGPSHVFNPDSSSLILSSLEECPNSKDHSDLKQAEPG